MRGTSTLVTMAVAVGMVARCAAAQSLAAQDLKRLTLEELLRVEVTTVMRVPEPTMAIPAAVFVITQDDIRRSGATSLPELLRLAPGVQVSQQDAARYAIGIRGFADRLSRSMLVLMDGRAVYSPLFAGTYWEIQDTMLDDIDRIEIIRGPGGTLWGANAVNGIINIITKRARDTQGTLVNATLGTETRGPAAIRYGGAAGARGFYRAYAKVFEREAGYHPSDPAYDTFANAQGGFRGDWTLTGSRTLTVQSDVYRGELGQRYSVLLDASPFTRTSFRDATLSGGNVLARWVAPFAAGELQLQTYYDRVNRDEQPVAESRDTVDIDFQHRRALGRRHALVWGTSFRVTDGRITAVAPSGFAPPRRTDRLYTAFVQDDLTIRPNRLQLVVGTKLEHNDYSAFEFQPRARLMWTPSGAHSVFAAVTRAVRTPSRVETDYTTTSLSNPALPSFVRLQPNQQFRPEEVTAYETGYRFRTIRSLYVTASIFFNQLEHTLSTELLTPFVETSPSPRLILPVSFANGLHGNAHGIEVTGDIRPVSWWRSTANYSWLATALTRNPGSADVSQERRGEGLSPRHQLQLASSVELPYRVSFEWFFRYMSELPAAPVPSYATSNVRLSWQVRNQLELALIGRNLHQARHLEWPTGSGANVFVERNAQITLIWRR